MAVTPDLLTTYRAPRRVLRRQLGMGVREDRALAYLMIACGLIFLAQWPRLLRAAAASPEVPLEALMGAALLGWGIIAPLFFYLLAGLCHLIARALGGRGSWYSARLALFWTLLAVAPLWLLYGLVDGLAPSGPVTALAGAGLLAVFLALFAAALVEAEREKGVEFDEGVT